ncbi:MAG: HAD family hydrolase [Oscillospiraceae bacterium]|nr:HAD family hydrolase [Oscillospiraceae bacterium]
MKTGILFDLDGTLLDTLDDLTDSVNHTLRQFGCPERSKAEIRSYLGTGARNLIRQALPGKADDPDLDRALAAYQDWYDTHNRIKTRPYDGILEALDELQKDYPVAIVSNKPDRAVKPMCKEYFGQDIYALGEKTDCPRKPAPDMVYAGMAAIGATKCVYVGDSEVDVFTAKNAGMPCLTVLWGFRDEDFLKENGAEHFCDDPKKLAASLKELIENG